MEDLANLITDNDTAVFYGLLAYLFFISPFEIFIHEFGHFYFQRKFGIQMKYIKIGLIEIFRTTFLGVPFIVGLIPFIGESLGVGEGPEWDKERSNPKSFSYTNRHPRERVIIALAGPLTSLCVFTPVFALFQAGAYLTGFTLSPVFYIIIAMLWITELSNLIIPFKIFGYPSDAYYVYQGLYQWWRWKAPC